jgi:hypothetical protein
MDQTLKERKLRADAQEKPLKYVQKLEKAAQRPPTPRLPTPREDDDDLEQASLLLQRLIRGRVIQNKMYMGKERRLTLINELRTRHSLQRNADIIGIADDDDIIEEKVSAAPDSNKKEDINATESQMRSLSLRAAELLSIPGGEAAHDESHLIVSFFKKVSCQSLI